MFPILFEQRSLQKSLSLPPQRSFVLSGFHMDISGTPAASGSAYSWTFKRHFVGKIGIKCLKINIIHPLLVSE